MTKQKIKNIDRYKINRYVLHAYKNCSEENIEKKILCIKILPNHGLNPDELKIEEGIILANGYDYYEIDDEYMS